MVEKIFYHIHKISTNGDNSIWHEGSIIEIGNELNDFYKQSVQFEPKFPEYMGYKNIPWVNVCKYVLQNFVPGSKEYREVLYFGENVVTEYGILLREIAYEEVRSKYFNNLPSRTKCIYLCKKEQLDFWESQFFSEYKVFKVKIFGDVFKSNNNLIAFPSDSYEKILEKAKKYWNYNSLVDEETDEYLYVGKLEILEEL